MNRKYQIKKLKKLLKVIDFINYSCYYKKVLRKQMKNK